MRPETRNPPTSHLLDWHLLGDDVWTSRVAAALEHARAGKAWTEAAKGRSIALMFFNPSLRTRTSMELAAAQMGAFSTTLVPGQETWRLAWNTGHADGRRRGRAHRGGRRRPLALLRRPRRAPLRLDERLRAGPRRRPPQHLRRGRLKSPSSTSSPPSTTPAKPSPTPPPSPSTSTATWPGAGSCWPGRPIPKPSRWLSPTRPSSWPPASAWTSPSPAPRRTASTRTSWRERRPTPRRTARRSRRRPTSMKRPTAPR